MSTRIYVVVIRKLAKIEVIEFPGVELHAYME